MSYVKDKSLQSEISIKPFLRWAGGKSRFAHEVISRLPALGQNCTYYEPFMGAAAVFLAYMPAKAVLSDLNPNLTAAFNCVRDDAKAVAAKLRALCSSDSESAYYRVRSVFNEGGDDIIQAARFIYLNQTCFNGIFRVNQQGKFNVPYGFKSNPKIPSKDELQVVSERLKTARILMSDYKHAVVNASKGDVIYLDPPYPPLNGTSYFTHYTKERFAEQDQTDVASLANNLKRKGCHVIVTNADTPLIRELYHGWIFSEIERPRWITCSRHKHRVVELVIASDRWKEIT